MAEKKSIHSKIIEKQTYHNIKKAYDKLLFELFDLFNEMGITALQYDLLEVLELEGSSGLPIKKIGEQMLSRQPDVTRIVDRLEKMGLVERERNGIDRRIVIVTISKKGAELRREAGKRLLKIHKCQFKAFSDRDFEIFNQLLEKLQE